MSSEDVQDKIKHFDATNQLWSAASDDRCHDYIKWHQHWDVRKLLQQGANVLATDELGNTAAHLAAKSDNFPTLAMLPFEAKWRTNKAGNTPLMEAVIRGSRRCAIHLLHLFRQKRYFDKKSKLLGIKNSENRTALDLAKESTEITQQIILWASRRCCTRPISRHQTKLGQRVNCWTGEPTRTRRTWPAGVLSLWPR